MYRAMRTIAPVLGILILASCSQTPKELQPVDQAMARAMRQFHKERYIDALDRFTKMTLDYAGSSLMDSIRYMEAECQYQMDEFMLAADLYEEVATRYPNSPLVENSLLRRADCWYELSPNYALDQTYTLRALDEYQALLEEHPDSPHKSMAEERIAACRHKLAFKEMKSAELYVRMEQWPAALLYLDQVLETWYDQPDVMELSLYYKVLCQQRMKRVADTRATAEEYLRTWPDGSHLSEVKALLGGLE